MRKTFLKVSLLAVLGLGMSASFTSCKDYDSEIDDLQGQIDQLKSKVTEIENLVKGGSVITGVTQAADGGVTFTMSDGKTVTIPAGKNGKDADVWTIVKNAEGAYYWAKNGEITEFPAQGPAGVAEPGICYVPNEDGFFYEYNPATGESKKTDIEWRSKGGNLSAVATEDKVILTGVVDADGKPADDITIWRSMFVKSLVVKPELYLDGIEATRYEVVNAGNALKTNGADGSATQDVPYSLDDQTKKTTATVAKGQPFSYEEIVTNGNKTPIVINEKATIAYALNPNNAVIDGMNYELLIDDIEVVNRGSGVSGEVLGVVRGENGTIDVTYQLSGTDKLAPYSTTKDGKEVGNVTDWTFMALQVQNPQNDSNLVTSDNVAILKETVALTHLMVDANVPVATKTWAETSNTAALALQEVANNPLVVANTPVAPVLQAPYNVNFNLAEHIAIAATRFTNMIEGDGVKTDVNGDNAQNDTQAKKEDVLITLAEAAEKYELTANYSLVTYTVAPNETSEDRFASISNSTSGIVTPMYVDNAGNSVATSSTAGRSAIGRRPLVYITLTNAKGQIALAGFVKIQWVEKEAASTSTILASAKVPYICDYNVNSTWEQITGKIYEDLGVTPEEFFNNYELVSETAVYEEIDGEMVNTTGNKDVAMGTAAYGTWSWTDYEGGTGAHTQKLVFNITNKNYETWYPTFKNNKFAGYDVTTTPVTKTLYAQFKPKTYNRVVYMGFNITVIGAPAANYVTKLASQWSTDMEVAPINPAVPGQTTAETPVQKATGYPYAAAMSMNFTSVWVGGQPVLKDADALYNFGGKADSPYLLKPNKAQYNFAAEQANVVGLSGTEYKISLAGKIDKKVVDIHALYATAQKDGKDNGAAQPIAVITSSNPDQYGHTNATLDGASDWEVISMVPYYTIGTSGAVLTPSRVGASTDEWTVASYACDIVNAQPFNKEAPAITFNVEMVVTYGQVNNEDGEQPNPAYSCELVIPGEYELMVGVGRPLAINSTNTDNLQDAVNSYVLVSKLFSMSDWQGHLLWNTSRTGKVTANTFNGTDLAKFWLSQASGDNSIAGYQVSNWPNEEKAGITVDVTAAKVSDTNAYSDDLKNFFDVYVDKDLTLVADKTPVEGNKTTVTDIKDLNDLKITWTNNGSAVVKNIYVFVPVYITYVWGENVLIGHAMITVEPTLSE